MLPERVKTYIRISHLWHSQGSKDFQKSRGQRLWTKNSIPSNSENKIRLFLCLRVQKVYHSVTYIFWKKKKKTSWSSFYQSKIESKKTMTWNSRNSKGNHKYFEGKLVLDLRKTVLVMRFQSCGITFLSLASIHTKWFPRK